MHRGGWIRFTLALGALALPIAACSAIPARGWTVVDLGTLGGASSYGAAISNSGFVVGCADPAGGGGARAFIYSDGTMRDLGTGGGPASGSSCALAVNNEGVAAGRSSAGEIVIWKAAEVTRLGLPGDVGAIDDRGTVVGAFREGPSTRAFRYAGGTITTIAGENSHASRINARGQIVGAAGGRAFLFDNGQLRDLGTLGGNGSNAKGLNDRGEVVGISANANGQPQPFIYDGAMRALPGPTYSGAVAINNRGQVVGSAEGTYGYLIDGGEYIRLDTLAPVVAKGWRRLEPTGINDRGWIVGTASTAEGDLRAFLLIPRGAFSSMQITR